MNRLLTDAGPLVAIVEPNDANRTRCLKTADQNPQGLVTTWPCFSEAMWLLGRRSGYLGQASLWQLVDHAQLILYESAEAELPIMRQLMRRYADLPMDLADASVVTAAEALGTKKIFTIDSDFLVYRPLDGGNFTLVP
jgi:predicted nucleic acid-binding protein